MKKNELLIKKLSNVSGSDVDDSPDINMEYSYDSTQWIILPLITSEGVTIHIPKKSKVYLRGNNNRLAIDRYDINNKQYICYINITCTNNHNIGGNIMSLVHGSQFINKTTFPSNSSLMLYG